MLLEHPFAGGVGARLLLEDQVVAQLVRFRQWSTSSAEAGGILLGFRRADHLHVVDSSAPGRLDRRARFGFERRDPLHQQKADTAWQVSAGTMDYLGEWHTHPEARPMPSALDEREWKRLCKNRAEPLVFLIVGTNSMWCGVGLNHQIRSASPVSA